MKKKICFFSLLITGGVLAQPERLLLICPQLKERVCRSSQTVKNADGKLWTLVIQNGTSAKFGISKCER
ncbi:hypothetical protein CleRT_15840 [Candidatus Coxiella mudrowiae]|uniref:Uncharacterized protein n=1 Tax=Candidatus Coxiella mudrowiae TaxID=2054173 RepID=A0ABM5UVT7_9COXI|nr:hypothetical protein CleRT_15840 [Candidatus Coxiella mudrowiae]